MESVDADNVVGPVFGLDHLGVHRRRAEHFAADFHRAIKDEIGPEQNVVYAPDFQPMSSFGERAPVRTFELTYFLDSGTINCVGAAKEFRSGRILALRRVTLVQGDRPLLESQVAAQDMATYLLNEAWRTLATLPEAEGPLPVAMFNAAMVREVGGGTATDSGKTLMKLADRQDVINRTAWKQTDRRLCDLRAAEPDDVELKLMHAVHTHSKYVSLGHQLFAEGIDERTADEEFIETLVLEALPYIQRKPEHTIMAAKLLHFLNRGYAELAWDLAEEAYGESLSIASSLAIVGQLRAFAGRTEAALSCLNQALNLVKPGSKPHLYTLVMKCQALMAAGDWDGLKTAKRELYGSSPLAALFFEPLFPDPGGPSLRARAVMMAMSQTRASAALKHLNYVSVRLFQDPVHRRNSIGSPLSLAIRRFGPDVVPDDVAMAYPDLVADLT